MSATNRTAGRRIGAAALVFSALSGALMLVAGALASSPAAAADTLSPSGYAGAAPVPGVYLQARLQPSGYALLAQVPMGTQLTTPCVTRFQSEGEDWEAVDCGSPCFSDSVQPCSQSPYPANLQMTLTDQDDRGGLLGTPYEQDASPLCTAATCPVEGTILGKDGNDSLYGSDASGAHVGTRYGDAVTDPNPSPGSLLFHDFLIDGGPGDDTITATPAAQPAPATGSFRLVGDSGNDRFLVEPPIVGLSAPISIDAGPGDDVIGLGDVGQATGFSGNVRGTVSCGEGVDRVEFAGPDDVISTDCEQIDSGLGGAAPGTGGPAEPHAPVALPDSLQVDAGETVEANLLTNDHDPDGDRLHAKVLKISFAHTEWSGLEPDGTFLYTAGPGTSRELRKEITYVAIDSGGLASKPVVSTVVVKPGPRSRKNPRSRARPGARVSGASGWEGPFSYASVCYPGGGPNVTCYTMNSFRNTQMLNRDTSWRPTLSTAAKWCLKYGFVPMAPADCAKTLAKKGIGFLGDRYALHLAAGYGCFLSVLERRRTPLHPLSGAWGGIKVDPYDSPTLPWRPGNRYSGWARWYKGGLHLSAKWRIPLLCGGDGNVYRQLVARTDWNE